MNQILAATGSGPPSPGTPPVLRRHFRTPSPIRRVRQRLEPIDADEREREEEVEIIDIE